MPEREIPWQVRHSLRAEFLRHYDDDRSFMRRLRLLSEQAAELPLPSDEPLVSLPHRARATMPPVIAEGVERYCADVAALAADVGLAGLESLPGIRHSHGPGLIHAWCVDRPIPDAAFSRSPFVHGGIEPNLRLRVEARYDGRVETFADYEYHARAGLDAELARVRENWHRGTQVTARGNESRDARAAFLRVRHGWAWARVAAALEVSEVEPATLARAAHRFGRAAGLTIGQPKRRIRAVD